MYVEKSGKGNISLSIQQSLQAISKQALDNVYLIRGQKK